MLRRTMMASAIAALTAPVTAAGYPSNILPKAFLRKGRQRFAAPARLIAQC